MNSRSILSRGACSIRQMVFFISLFALFIVVFSPVWKGLVASWYTSDDYSHGFLIVPIAVYIAWQKRAALASVPVRGSWWGLGLLILSLVAYVIAHFAGIVTVASFSMVPAIAGTVLFLFGPGYLRKLLFQIALLLFMIPVPAQVYSTLTVPLQLFVSQVSTWIGALLGISIYREGNVIHLSDRTLQVVQACSGLRSMISLLTLGAVFGYFTLRSNLLRFCLFLSAIPAAIFVNIVRVTVMIMAFHYFQIDLTVGSTHTVFGILIFFLAFAFIIATKGVLSHWDRSAKETSSS